MVVWLVGRPRGFGSTVGEVALLPGPFLSIVERMSTVERCDGEGVVAN